MKFSRNLDAQVVSNTAGEKIILHRYRDSEKRVRICVGFKPFVCLLGFLQSRIVGKRDIGMQFLFGLADSPKDGLRKLLRRKFPLAEFFPGFMKRECGKIHSMILGT